MPHQRLNTCSASSVVGETPAETTVQHRHMPARNHGVTPPRARREPRRDAAQACGDNTATSPWGNHSVTLPCTHGVSQLLRPTWMQRIWDLETTGGSSHNTATWGWILALPWLVVIAAPGTSPPTARSLPRRKESACPPASVCSGCIYGPDARCRVNAHTRGSSVRGDMARP